MYQESPLRCKQNWTCRPVPREKNQSILHVLLKFNLGAYLFCCDVKTEHFLITLTPKVSPISFSPLPKAKTLPNFTPDFDIVINDWNTKIMEYSRHDEVDMTRGWRSIKPKIGVKPEVGTKPEMSPWYHPKWDTDWIWGQTKTKPDIGRTWVRTKLWPNVTFAWGW